MKEYCVHCKKEWRTNKRCDLCMGIQLVDHLGNTTDYVLVPKKKKPVLRLVKRCEASDDETIGTEKDS